MRTTYILLAPLLAALPTAPLAAQGNGVILLAHVDDGSSYNDIWGYTAPDGREFAIVGTTDGTQFFDCSDPVNPVQVGFIDGPNSLWRDMKTWDQYCYIVSEGGGSIQIVSLVNPDSPTLVGTAGQSIFSSAHNIAIDTGSGLAYVSGTNNGLPVFDLSNPVSPAFVGNYSGSYAHDLHVQNGKAHLAQIYAGDYRIIDATPPFASQGSVRTPGHFTHHVWANASDTLAVTTDEVTGGLATIYDISNPANIQQLSTFTVNPATIPHNAFWVGDRIFCSWYTEGLVVIDASNPSNPTLLGQYDTSSFSGGGFSGAWGCYPFSPSGVIYVSDIESGFYILQLDEDTDSILLTGPGTAQVGAMLSYSISSAPASSPAFLLYSLNQNGSVINGQSFDIGNPIRTAATGTTDASGSLAWTVGPVPSAGAGRTVFVEARVDGPAGTRDSNMLPLSIQ